MNRCLALMIAGGFAAAASGCYEVAVIPPKPTPAREFAGKPELKANLAKFLEKLGEATTSVELRAAWESVYPDHGRVVHRAISKSINDFYWPVAPVTDGRVFVEGFRAAAEELVETPSES